MFDRLKDALFFESRLNDTLRRCGFDNLLVGNRAAEIHGQSASHGEDHDVYLIRKIHADEFPKLVYYGKKRGEDSQSAVRDYLCGVFDRYLSEIGSEVPPESFATCVEQASRSQIDSLSSRWRKVVERHQEDRRRKYEEQKKRLPEIVSARPKTYEELKALTDRLQPGNIDPDAAVVWHEIPTDFATEWQIHQETGVPLCLVVPWLEAFYSIGLVVKIGTALPEPKFRKSPTVPQNKTVLALRDELDQLVPKPSSL